MRYKIKPKKFKSVKLPSFNKQLGRMERLAVTGAVVGATIGMGAAIAKAAAK